MDPRVGWVFLVATLLAACDSSPPEGRQISDVPNSAHQRSPGRPAPSRFRGDARQLAARLEVWSGAFAIRHMGSGETLVVNEAHARRRFTPCSTFKVCHSLIGLDSGVLQGPDTMFRWDGTKQNRKAAERDQTLASAIKHSVVWYFQRVARSIGKERMQSYLNRLQYGNRSIPGAIDRFWLDRNALEISALEQIAFLARLFRSELPIAKEAQATVRSLIRLEQDERGRILSGKTGSGRQDAEGLTIGWLVGHVRDGVDEYVFATNIRARDDAYGWHAKDATRELLADLGLYGDAG